MHGAILSLALLSPAGGDLQTEVALALAGRPAPDPALPTVSPDYEWRRLTNRPGWVGLWDDGKQVGALSESTGRYYPLHKDGCWGPACEPPVTPPKKRAAAPRPAAYYPPPPPVYHAPRPAFFGPPAFAGGGCGPGRG